MSTQVPVLPNPRRIVTGHDGTGKAVLSMDGPLQFQVSEVFGEIVRTSKIWTTEGVPTRDNNSNSDASARVVPGPIGLVLSNGMNHQITDLAPGALVPIHRTATVDYNIVLSGRLVLIVDDDVRTEIAPGGVVIQRGTVHAWHNPSTTEWTRWVSVLIHAEPAIVNGKVLEDI